MDSSVEKRTFSRLSRVPAGAQPPTWHADRVHPAPSVVDRPDDENVDGVSVVEENIDGLLEMTKNSDGTTDGIPVTATAEVVMTYLDAPLPPELLVQVAGTPRRPARRPRGWPTAATGSTPVYLELDHLGDGGGDRLRACQPGGGHRA